MADSLAGVVLAAGRGDRLRPLSLRRPKVLCPINGTALLDLALARLEGHVEACAVNAHHFADRIVEHLAARPVHVSVEPGEARGTAGGLALLRDWLDGRDAVVLNGDTWITGSLEPLIDGWDRERIRVFVHGADELRPGVGVAGALMPWSEIERLPTKPSGLVETSWGEANEAGRLDVVRHEGDFVDCGTPHLYWRANLRASEGASVIPDPTAVAGHIERVVLWPGAVVRADERLVDAVRCDARTTVLLR